MSTDEFKARLRSIIGEDPEQTIRAAAAPKEAFKMKSRQRVKHETTLQCPCGWSARITPHAQNSLHNHMNRCEVALKMRREQRFSPLRPRARRGVR
jgi:hypothetical protein